MLSGIFSSSKSTSSIISIEERERSCLLNHSKLWFERVSYFTFHPKVIFKTPMIHMNP